MHNIDQLREAFEYFPDTGRVIRKSTGVDASYPTKTGYCRIFLGRKKYKLHRVVWAIENGYWPETIDHINGDRADNRIANLRDVSARENSLNSRLRPDNKSGCSGVNWNSKTGKWQAQIRDNGSYVYLGLFEILDDAISARKAAEVRYGYHKNHGSHRARYERD